MIALPVMLLIDSSGVVASATAADGVPLRVKLDIALAPFPKDFTSDLLSVIQARADVLADTQTIGQKVAAAEAAEARLVVAEAALAAINAEIAAKTP